MTLDKDSLPAAHEERRQQLRQLEHDMRTYLGVVTMGVQALDAFRDDAEEFAELSRTIEEEGVKPLRETIAEIISVALRDQQ